MACYLRAQIPFSLMVLVKLMVCVIPIDVVFADIEAFTGLKVELP